MNRKYSFSQQSTRSFTNSCSSIFISEHTSDLEPILGLQWWTATAVLSKGRSGFVTCILTCVWWGVEVGVDRWLPSCANTVWNVLMMLLGEVPVEHWRTYCGIWRSSKISWSIPSHIFLLTLDYSFLFSTITSHCKLLHILIYLAAAPPLPSFMLKS